MHPCDTNKGGCAEICTRDGDKAKCACKKGWGLQADGKKCRKCKQISVISLLIISKGSKCKRFRYKIINYRIKVLQIFKVNKF